MRRREILKALATVPIASALGNCLQYRPSPTTTPSKEKDVHTVQILLEGAFAVVLQKNKPNRLIAFVPRSEEKDHNLEHNFYFNDPESPQEIRRTAGKDPAGYHFQLSEAGLRNYAETFVNPGFADFEAYTQKWRLPERIVTLELPFPNSINFSGRPLHVEFTSGRPGLMPTNYILEYYVEDASRVSLTCSQLGDKCAPSPNCPPNVLRYFFGVSPAKESARKDDKDDAQEHAVSFFNFTIRQCFPELEEHLLKYIEPSEKSRRRTSSAIRPKLMPGVMTPDAPSARLMEVSAALDCQSIGPLVRTSTSATV
ncbi:MAG: hypothetical protein WCE73_01985 [Candidatus Angelobacter sp.]